jgi:hypothetical protein
MSNLTILTDHRSNYHGHFLNIRPTCHVAAKLALRYDPFKCRLEVCCAYCGLFVLAVALREGDTISGVVKVE